MILFKNFDKKNYDSLLKMMLEFYSSDAVDQPIDKEIVNKLLDDILSGEYSIKGVEAYYDNELVGFGVITSYYASEVAGITIQLEDLFIKEDYRSKGIAKSYFKTVMENHPEAVRFRLEVCASNTKAIDLYKRMGFEKLEYDQMIFNIEDSNE
ncbi:GNAT family N-acetyltransferase [Peptostreptococcus russellii]|uniref:GNAT family N-acetyltransferase n=1 Tax=Peptostreptococcus russellii TaxID=215200 RepID=UPI001623C2A7|nr:GNAT family N-acetyltransferase [Peptostreptococcus russellii]MBC2577050.1 GNAT family N-acetyltransferase [Peptostreptococcus russellii]